MTENELAELFPFKRNHIKVASWDFHYVDEGEGDTLVLFHSCPMWSFSFRGVVRRLRKKYRVIAPDLLGFGLSEKPHDFDYTLNGYIDLLDQFLTELKLEKMSFVIHGWGGTIGMGVAVRHPNRIRSLIVMNSMAFSDYRLPLRLQIGRIPWIGSWLVVHSRIMYSGGFFRLPKRVREAYMYPFTSPDSTEALRKFARLIPTAPESDSAQTILDIEGRLWLFRTKSVCIIWATKDWLYGPHCLKIWHKRLPGAEIHSLAGAGRYVTEEQSSALEDIIEEFLDKTPDLSGQESVL